MSVASRITHHDRFGGTGRNAFAVRCGAFLTFLPFLPLVTSAQSPVPTRLEQLEATYQANLRTLHAPVLQDYLRQLELLKTQLAARNRTEDAGKVDAEIARVKSLTSTTGVLPYTALQEPAGGTGSAAPETSPPSGTRKSAEKTAPLPTLLAAEAFKGADLHPKTKAVPIGSAEWRLFNLPAGTYDILVVFASGSLPLPELITVRIGGQEVKASIPSERATGSDESFHLLRLCSVTLASDITSGTLAMDGNAGGPPHVWFRKVMFARPKPPPPPKV